MRIISAGVENISKVWGSPKPSHTIYRAMAYEITADCEEGRLLFNAITGELVLLNSTETAIMDSTPGEYSAGMDELIAHHFLVPIEFDEQRSVAQLRQVLRKVSAKEGVVSYTILPTTACNARCFYCYESDYPKSIMSETTADSIVDYIVEHCGERKTVSLHWFGGEPTLGEKLIDRICDGLLGYGVSFESSMISNGYLLSEELTHKACHCWKLRNVQITLDGTEEIYNRVKAYQGVSGSPFLRVMDNIGILLANEVRVVVRLNVDQHNSDDLVGLIDIISNRYGSSNYLSVYLHELFEDVGYSPVNHTIEEWEIIEKSRVSLEKYIQSRGLSLAREFFRNKQLPSLKVYYCMALDPSTIVINPDGSIGKCEHDLFTHQIGTIEGNEIDHGALQYWTESKTHAECEVCPLYPICGIPIVCQGNPICRVGMMQRRTQNIRTALGNRYHEYTRGYHRGKE